MAEVTNRTIAQNHMLASGKLALVMAAEENGDCDADGLVEPLEWSDANGNPAPIGGGYLPPTIGAALQDPWGSTYGYCAWDHGAVTQDDACGHNAHRLEGGMTPENPVIAIVSAGSDRQFQTICQPQSHGGHAVKTSGSDDLILAYSFVEAKILAGGLWNLKEGDVATATIAENLSVTDGGGIEQLTFNASQRALSIGAGGTGNLPNIRTDYIQSLTTNAPIEFLTNIKTGGTWISGDGSDKGMKIDADGKVDLSGDITAVGMLSAGAATITTEEENAVAAILTSSGDDGIALKASGTSKAIEAAGVIDMTLHKIVHLAAPVANDDAVTKKYIDDAIGSGTIKCESFTANACLGGVGQALTKTSLGACKKACENAGAQCCYAAFPILGNNPNATLGSCIGYDAPSQPVGSRLLSAILGTVAAYCYRMY